MGFFSRLSDIVAANINELLDRMENPAVMMKQLIREMEDAVVQARGLLTEAITHERRLEKELAAQGAKAEEWQARAVEAVNHKRDDLARKALELRHETQAIIAALEPQLKAAAEAATSMRTQLAAIEAKCQEAKRQQAALIARQKAAEMKTAIVDGKSSGKVGTSAFDEFARMEDKIAQMEAEADAKAEVSGRAWPLDREFAELDRKSTIDAELAELKKHAKK